MVESIAEVVDAAERALSTFAAADRARDAAGQRFEAAMGEAASLAVRCDNGYSCGGDNRLDYSDDLVAAYARNFEALSAMMAANADYVEAVGISGADAGRARAARLRRFANRMRGLQGRSGEAVQRRNALLDEVRAELDGASRLHSRAVEAHIAANRAAIDALSRAARMVSTAAARLTDDYYPATRAVEVTRAAAALDQAAAAAADPQVSNDSDATDQALEELIFASRETFVVLESHVQLVEQAARDYERDPEPQVPDELPAVRRPPEIEVAPAADLDAWANQVRDAVMEVERAAGEAEETAAGSGSWMSRFTGCEATYLRLLRSVNRVQDLTIGSGRPDFIPGGAGSEAWRQLSERIGETRRRASDACASIEPPRR